MQQPKYDTGSVGRRAASDKFMGGYELCTKNEHEHLDSSSSSSSSS